MGIIECFCYHRIYFINQIYSNKTGVFKEKRHVFTQDMILKTVVHDYYQGFDIRKYKNPYECSI